MQKIGTFLKKATQTIFDKTKQNFDNFHHDIQQIELAEEEEAGQTSLVRNQIGKQPQVTPSNKEIDSEKVLQIDVVQSGYLLKSEQQIVKASETPQLSQLPQKKNSLQVQHEGSPRGSRMNQIEQEKRQILEELKKLDQQIAEVKGQTVEDGALKRRQKQLQNQEAAKNARGLVKQLKQQRKQIQERKRKQAEKTLQLLRQQEQERKIRQLEEKERIKEEKRKRIEARMQEEKRKRQERKLIEKQSNQLLKQLKKQQKVLKQKEEIPHETGQIEQKKKVVEKKFDVNFRQIQQHERRYIQMKQSQRSAKKQRAQSVNHHVPQYKKNMWLEQIEEQQNKKKEEQIAKEAMRKGQLEKRKKYGELVKNIFPPKQTKKETFQEESRDKVTTPDTNLLPRIPESEKRVTDSKHMKKFTENNRPFATAHNPKPPRPKKLEKIDSENLETEKQRKMKEAELRRQTKQRLKKLENKSIEHPKSLSKPKYENYLGKVKVKADNATTSWKKIIDNESISKEDKYKEMLRRAAAMENKAKVKEEVRKDGDEEAVNLYIGSIQAKLAILQKF